MAGRGRNIERTVAHNGDTEKCSSTGTPRIRLMAKYSYARNPDMPGGFEEIGLQQFEKVWLLKRGHKDNTHWWEIENDKGHKGFAPAQYLTIVEEGVATLPWLNKDPEPDKEDASVTSIFGQPPIKRYVPTYAENRKTANAKEYYCELCQREFNGPIPLKAHLRSKAHKEEEMIAKEYQ